jgi:hypothetical protein
MRMRYLVKSAARSWAPPLSMARSDELHGHELNYEIVYNFDFCDSLSVLCIVCFK